MGDQPEIVVYSSPTCLPCKSVKNFLDQRNLDYTVWDISKNPKKKKEMLDKSGQMAVPTVEVAGEILVGFQKDKLESLLMKYEDRSQSGEG